MRIQDWASAALGADSPFLRESRRHSRAGGNPGHELSVKFQIIEGGSLAGRGDIEAFAVRV
jgi:hypothetical protein